MNSLAFYSHSISMTKILIADDHTVVRKGIQTFLNESFDKLHIDEVVDGTEILKKISYTNYDLLIMDIQMPNTDAFDIMQYIKIKFPDVKVLVFSMSPENIYGLRFLKAGASGFLSKDQSLHEFKKAIETILSGGKYISKSLAEFLTYSSFTPNAATPFEKLSKREFEVMSLLLAGNSINDISHQLNIHSSTIGTHKARIFEKLNVINMLELKELADLYKM